MNRRITGFVLCLSVATLSQVAMAQPGQGRGGQMRDMIPGEQMRQEAGRSGDVRRDVPQRERREYQQQQRELNQSEMERLRERERIHDSMRDGSGMRDGSPYDRERMLEHQRARDERMREAQRAWEERSRQRFRN